MTNSRLPLRRCAAVILLAAAGAAQAAINTTSSTSTASFAAAFGGTVDKFSDLTINTNIGATTLNRAPGSFAYQATTQTDFFVVPVAGNVALSTGTFSDTITFGGFAPGVYAFGANFYGTNILGELTSGGLTITATDINGLSRTATLAGNSLTGFVGFFSDRALASVTVGMTSPNTNVYASLDNVVLAVPEPTSLALLLSGGLVLLGVHARRRR